jgi:hypothetical protein
MSSIALSAALMAVIPAASEEPWTPTEAEFTTACTSSRIEEGGLTLAQIDAQCLFDYHKHLVVQRGESVPDAFLSRCEVSVYRAIHTEFPTEKERARDVARSSCVEMNDSLVRYVREHGG